MAEYKKEGILKKGDKRIMSEHPYYWDIRFTKIHFRVEFVEATEVVREKGSALRGGMGEMLLRAHCIADRNCDGCGFESECIVQRTMYSKFTNVPVSMHPGDSVGYIMLCTDTRRRFAQGDQMDFILVLFGKNIVYFSQYLNAFHALGLSGLGRNQSRYRIVSVKNLFGEQILDGNNIYMQNYKWQRLGDYIGWRRKNLTEEADGYQIVFQTPVSMKYQGQFISDISAEALGKGLIRRLNILSAFEELCSEDRKYEPETEFPEILSQQTEAAEVSRYSSRKDSHVKLRGIKGQMRLGKISQEWMDALLAGEIVQLGRNTSFGFGKYIVR